MRLQLLWISCCFVCFVLIRPTQTQEETSKAIVKQNCSQNHFQCHDDQHCISQRRMCNGVKDCSDGSDEPLDCPPVTCRPLQFQCVETKKCIPLGWTCDGEPDCGGSDRSDEDPQETCFPQNRCPANMIRCGASDICKPASVFCDGHGDCPNGDDEGVFCKNRSLCDSLNCEYGCKPTPRGLLCYCGEGKQANETHCDDLNECEEHGSCDQLCKNLIGSFDCDCVAGYKKVGHSCLAINEPEHEPPSILISSADDIQRFSLNGSVWPNSQKITNHQKQALAFNHRNQTVCFINEQKLLQCVHVDHMDKPWNMPSPSLYSLESVTEMDYDWVSGNWYFLDDTHEVIFLCNGTMQACIIIVEINISKPRGIALDPTRGFMFFTKWGSAPPSLERALIDGSERKILADRSIVYPYGVTVDYPNQHVYWVDTFLDCVERVDYNGNYRKMLRRGVPVQNLYDLALFENNLFLTSWRSHSIIRLQKFNGTYEIFRNSSGRPFSIIVYHRQRQPNVLHPCTDNNGGCQHICISAWEKGVPRQQCACQPGYWLNSDQHSCVIANTTKFVLYAVNRPGMIKGIQMKPNVTNMVVLYPIHDVNRSKAFDYDVKSQYIYYTHSTSNSGYAIMRRKIHGRKPEVVLEEGIENCEGLAVDWLGRNLYWTDEHLQVISVAQIAKPSQRKVLVRGQMNHPRAIVVDPRAGYMYWSDWAIVASQAGKIERAWMDGSKREMFVPGLHWPNGLSLDTTGKWLYWCDAYLDTIERIKTNGRERMVVFEGPALDHPYGLDLSGNYLYWTEFIDGVIKRLDLVNKTVDTLSEEKKPLYELRVFDNNTQVESSGPMECAQNNNECEHLCLIIPKGVVCACREGYDLQGKACIQKVNYTVPHHCTGNQFMCRDNKTCIDKSHVCDKDKDCPDGSDEDDSLGAICGETLTTPSYKENVNCSHGFKCDSTRCIHEYFVCDGEKDCQDGTDEDKSRCTAAGKTCGSDQFVCKVSGRCISKAWICDSEHDCGENDTSDEQHCGTVACQEYEFTCSNKKCISLRYYCDGANDCFDNSDEIGCSSKCDDSSMILCVADDKCISKAYKCDGRRDCSDGSDEMNCTLTERASTPPPVHCEDAEFMCHNFECIPKKFMCDGRKDCVDGSDEESCGNSTCTEEFCTKHHSNGSVECLYPSRYCDDNKKCVQVHQLCNGVDDCEDTSDEGGMCGLDLCFSNMNQECSHSCQNTPQGILCYCPPPLHLQPDGVTCHAQHPCEAWGVCAHVCEPTGTGHRCSCHSGYELQRDEFSCKSTVVATPYVIFSNRHELRGIDLHGIDLPSSSPKALISSLKNTIALDFYHTASEDKIFWTDVIDDKIYRGTLVGGSLSNIEVVVQTGLSTAEGLAVDWIGQNLYWVESNLDQIEVAKLNGSFRRTLVAGDMESPRAIALDPRLGLLFWTDWDANDPRIERCSMSGQYRSIVVHVDLITNGGWPNGLTLDYQLKRIYWIDARSDSIHTATYDGQDIKTVISNHETLSHPFAIALFDNYVYWTDWRTNSVIRANKWNGTDLRVIQKTLTQPFDIQILHPSRQPVGESNPCGINNSNCSHLCLLSVNNTYKCDCPHVMRLDKDNHTCVVNEQVLLFSRVNEIRGVDLKMPYYHTIPTISLPQVLSPSQLDFVASSRKIYWTDSQVNEVKRTGLTGGSTESIIDTGLDSPSGFAIDWISGNMYVTSDGGTFNHILVCNLEGEYIITSIISIPSKLTSNVTASLSNDTTTPSPSSTTSGSELLSLQDSMEHSAELEKKPTKADQVLIKSLALDPTRGKLYFSYLQGSMYIIEEANMDGSNRHVLASEQDTSENTTPRSLSMDLDEWRLYWISAESNIIRYYDFKSKIIHDIPVKHGARPSTVVVYQKLIYYADLNDAAIHVINNTKEFSDTILRNNTDHVLSMRIYDPNIQIGSNPCKDNKGNCSHLCLPVSATERVCRCGTGYKSDPKDPTKCIGIDAFLLFSINWEIRGLSLTLGDNTTQVLGPISRVSMAASVDFHAESEYLYWADSDHGSVTRIRRDGTGREVVVEHFESMEIIPMDWLTGLAVDWIAGNLYWTDPKLHVIEMSRLNGLCRYVVVTGGLDKPTSVVVDPEHGLLFWSDAGKLARIERAGLDGSNRIILANTSNGAINDLTLDFKEKKVYWCDSSTHKIERANYDGSIREVLLEHSTDTPYALTVFNSYLYWIDTTLERGSILRAPLSNVSDHSVMLHGIGDSLKDIQVFSKSKQMGSNPCAKNNGGCAELCLYNGTHPVCACAHGKVAIDGHSCEDYDAFLLYSRVLRLDSIHMTDANNLNAPFPSIQSKEHMRNSIALAYDYKRSLIFYSDIQRGSINSVHFNGTNHTVIIERHGAAEGLDYDAATKTLFWTCNNDLTINKIDLATNKSKVQTIVRLHPNDKPRGIAVDPCKAQVYWTNWNSLNPSIQRAYTNGFDIESIITTDIRMPNGLVLEHSTQKLYWCDARLDKIERAEYDGTNRVVLVKVITHHPFDIAVYGNYLFWTDWVLHAVLRVNKFTGEDVVILRKDVPRPMAIIAVANDTDSCASNPCMLLNGGCQHICKLNATGDVACSCYPGSVLLSDGKLCSTFAVECRHDSFACSSGRCIPYYLTCDGIDNCGDNSDESPSYCALRKCRSGYFSCGNGRCIPSNLTCNQNNDCGDGSDEEKCDCFRCASGGPCIKLSYVCDYDADCPDASDEMNCPERNCSWYGKPNLIKCNTTTACIKLSWICDGENDCWDNSDEKDCPSVTPSALPSCSGQKFRCSSGQCIPSAWRCDGDDDCGDSTELGLSSDETSCKASCRSDQFQCNNQDCIPITWLCDGTPDCPDGSDEDRRCETRVCSTSDFKCNSTVRCVPWLWVCDGEDDCGDMSDEKVRDDCMPNLSSCLNTQFKCSNNKCIPREYYCDGSDDCGDNSDEPGLCRPQVCQDNEFACHNGKKCVLTALTCNGVDDCGDNSDEEEKSCHNKTSGFCEGSQLYRCANGVCINETLLCNNLNDCGDFSDEYLCNVDECVLNKTCAHICKDKKIGYECQCYPGFKVSPRDPRLCSDIDECLELPAKPCSQICRNTRGSYVCSCQDGYTMIQNNYSCKANTGEEAKLMFSNRYYIREMDLIGRTSLRVHNLTNAVALDFDWAGKCIYWSDVTASGSSIKRQCEGNSSQQVLHSISLQNPDGLAVDWIGHNLYWCDKGSDTIEVSKLDGRFRRILISSGLQEPRAITLDPHHGYMYWTDWGDRPYIGKAGMDGSEQRIIINDSISLGGIALGWPNALTLSFETNELFWGDAREDYIAVSDLDGNNKRLVMSRASNPKLDLHHIFALAVFEDHLYWTDWETKSVERCNKYSGKDCRRLTTTVHRPMDIHVYHPYRQLPLANNPCENNGGCATLCLLRPNGGHQCACPGDYNLAQDKKSCLANCTSAHFECKNTYKCIPFWWKCDSQDDCGDGSDEPEGCPKFECHPGQYQCRNHNCIHPSKLCNGDDDCKDSSDEEGCDKYTCLNTQFKCRGNGTVSDRCISAQLRCNGKTDCLLGEDEKDCPPKTCPPSQFLCPSEGKCIPDVWVCDGDPECADGFDEKNCLTRKCLADQLRCSTGRCIPKSWRCDGDRDCRDGEDEPANCSNPDYHTCDPTYFKCQNNKCIPGRWQCDYDNDCGDGSDEVECKPRNCSESEFRCDDGRCIPGFHKCDGEFNCDDRSDEAVCNRSCHSNEFQCTSPPHCISNDWKCDGDSDCNDGSDEADCEDMCPRDKFLCTNKHCVKAEWKCDGDDDCGDGSDELDCASWPCEPGRHRCRRGDGSLMCIPGFYVCNGVPDCKDGSDEKFCHQSLRGHGECGVDQFICHNKNCILNSEVCDGSNDCGDNSDEENCPACRFGLCSQACIVKKHGNYSCHCEVGYTLACTNGKQTCENSNKTCVAKGASAQILITTDNGLRLFGKPMDAAPMLSLYNPSAVYKIDSVDAYWNFANYVVVFSDLYSRSIIQNNQTLVSGLSDPRGVALDWIHKLLYWVDSTSHGIMVANLDGTKKRTLINSDLYEPHDIAVDPQSGWMYWADWGSKTRIERANMDGSAREVLVNKQMLWPSGLAIDHHSRRLYWTDAKKRTIECVQLDGKNRRTILSFPRGERPYKLDVFEDSLYVVVQLTKSVMIKRFDKFGRFGLNGTVLSEGDYQRAPDLVVLQENKHPRYVTNVCLVSPCHQSALCVPNARFNSTSHTCLCPDGFITSFTAHTTHAPVVFCKPQPNRSTRCDLPCVRGRCYHGLDGPKCICEPMFEGDLCSKYRCSEYCMNGGRCEQADDKSMTPALKCTCPPLWTGARCEVPLVNCGCENGGTCQTPQKDTTYCSCPPNFKGAHCEDCETLKCGPNGVCYYNGTQPKCNCSFGFTGRTCSVSKCDGFCKSPSTCRLSSTGPKCTCAPGFSGEKCEKDKCKDFCKNGGKCVAGSKKQYCDCGPRYAGSHCEIDLCHCSCQNSGPHCSCVFPPPEECKSNVVQKCRQGMCKHGGTCIESRGNPVCRCTDEHNGPECETYYGNNHACINYCVNGGACHLDGHGSPSCSCLDGWYGVHCENMSRCDPSYCLNGGYCNESRIGSSEFICICPERYTGAQCQVSVPGLSPASDQSSNGTGTTESTSTGIIIAVSILIILLLAIGIAYYVTRRMRHGGKSFMHQRMTENVEINNPMYLREDLDDDGDNFTLDSVAKGNFSNPMYESMYNSNASTASGSVSEEKKGLLRGDDFPSQPHPLAGSREEL